MAYVTLHFLDQTVPKIKAKVMPSLLLLVFQTTMA